MGNSLEELFQRLWDEQQWRERKAQGYGVPQNDPSRTNGQMNRQFPHIGLYTDSLPLPLKDRMLGDPKWKDFMEYADRHDARGMPNSPGVTWTPLEEMFNKERRQYKGML